MSGGAIAAIVVAGVVALAVPFVLFFIVMTHMGTVVDDQFQQVFHCVDHPRAPECRPRTTFTP